MLYILYIYIWIANYFYQRTQLWELILCTTGLNTGATPLSGLYWYRDFQGSNSHTMLFADDILFLINPYVIRVPSCYYKVMLILSLIGSKTIFSTLTSKIASRWWSLESSTLISLLTWSLMEMLWNWWGLQCLGRNPTLTNGTVHPKRKAAKEREHAVGFTQYQTNYSNHAYKRYKLKEQETPSLNSYINNWETRLFTNYEEPKSPM